MTGDRERIRSPRDQDDPHDHDRGQEGPSAKVPFPKAAGLFLRDRWRVRHRLPRPWRRRGCPSVGTWRPRIPLQAHPLIENNCPTKYGRSYRYHHFYRNGKPGPGGSALFTASRSAPRRCAWGVWGPIYLWVIPRDSSVSFIDSSLEYPPATPLMASTFSGTTMASWWTPRNMYASPSTTVTESFQTVAS